MPIAQTVSRRQPATPMRAPRTDVAAAAAGWPQAGQPTTHGGPRVAVTAIPGGWMVSCDLCAGPLVFRSGGRAEAQARRLARWAAREWGRAELVLQDARGALVAAISIASDAPQMAVSRRAA